MLEYFNFRLKIFINLNLLRLIWNIRVVHQLKQSRSVTDYSDQTTPFKSFIVNK